jgi:hypothetical protein
MRRLAWRVIKWLLGAGVLAAILYFNWDRLQEMLVKGERFDLLPLLLAGLIYLAGVFLTFIRWYVLVRAQELPFRPVDAVRLGFISQFFSAFLPGSVGGDLVKAGFLAHEQHRRTVAIATIVMDRVLGLVGLLFLAGLAGALFWNEASAVVDKDGDRPLRVIVIFVWIVCAAVLAGCLLLFWILPYAGWLISHLERIRWIGRVLAELLRTAQMYRHRLRAVFLALGLAMIGHVGFVMSYYFASCAVPPPIPSLEEQWLLVPVGMVAESIPITPGNLGVGEALFDYLYYLADPGDGSYGSKGALARLALRVVSWAVALIGLGFYLPLRRTVKQLIAEEAAAEKEEASRARHSLDGQMTATPAPESAPRASDEAVP